MNRVSYAASFKISDIDEFAVDAYKTYLPRFSHISVRENNLKTYLKNELDIESTNVLDPTLLLKEDVWSELIKKNRLICEKYVLIYYVNQPVELVVKACEYAPVSYTHLDVYKRQWKSKCNSFITRKSKVYHQ